MTRTMKQVAVAIGAALILATVAAAGVYMLGRASSLGTVMSAVHDVSSAVVQAAGQDTSGGPGPFGGRGRGGPGRFGGPGGPPGIGPGPAGLALERLGLSEAQKDQAKAIMQSHQAETKGLGEREMAARQALDAAVAADGVDEGAIRARSAELGTIQADMAVAQARLRSEIFQILTPDQQAQVRQMQAQMKERQEQIRQRRDQRPPRPPQ